MDIVGRKLILLLIFKRNEIGTAGLFYFMSTYMTIPRRDWLELMKVLKSIVAKSEVWLTEEETCKLLGIKRITLSNYIANGKITPDMYRTGVGSNKFFNEEKIMGKAKFV